MSRTSQKKFSAYQEGIDDGLCGRPTKWTRHPQLDHYMAGYNEGKRAACPQPPRNMTFMERVMFVLFGYSP